MDEDNVDTQKLAQTKRSEAKSVKRNWFIFEGIKKELEDILKDELNDVASLNIELPPEHIAADLTFSTFEMGKLWKKNPQEIAVKIVEAIEKGDKKYIQKAEAAGAFVNLYLNKSEVFEGVLKEVLTAEDSYGQNEGNGKLAWVEYSAPNIAKPIGVGHLRSTIIGESLARIYERSGYAVIRHNYLGDWGTQFGKLIWAYQHWGEGKDLSVNELKDLYVRFHSEAEKNTVLEEEARVLSKKLEDGDPELTSLWSRVKKLSIADFEKTYGRLGVEFDTWLGESFFTDKMEDVMNDCEKQNLYQKDPETGAIFVDLSEGMPTFLLKRADGASLYITRDLASLKFRVTEAKSDNLLYVVGSEQELNFRQLFALAKRLGYVTDNQAQHINFGTLLADGKKMSTRRGTLIELEELLNQSVAKSKEILKEKNPELNGDEVKEISETVGIGAVIYNDLRQSRTQNISFDWDRMLNFESGSAAYLQYTYVRIQSILRKIEFGNKESYKFENEIEFKLAKKLLLFPAAILRAQKLNAPHIIATYLEELTQLFNGFYGEVSIINTEDAELKTSRLCLIKACASIIKSGLQLLNIKVPHKM